MVRKSDIYLTVIFALTLTVAVQMVARGLSCG